MSLTSEDWIAIAVALILGGLIVGVIMKLKFSLMKALLLQQFNTEREKATELEAKLGRREIELNSIRNQTLVLQQRDTELKTIIESERRATKEREAL